MESVAAERLNKIGIRDHNIVNNGSASDNEATSISQDAQDVSAIVSALAQQQSESEAEASDEEGLRHRKLHHNSDSNFTQTHTSDPSNLHLVAKDLHQVGRMIIQTTSLLPRPRSESCFSTMESESEQERPRKSNQRSPHKKMLHLPLNPLKKKLLNPSIHKSETVLSPPSNAAAADNNGHHHHHKSPFLSLKTPPAVLTKPSSHYPGAKKLKKERSVTTPLANVPPPPPPGTLPGYYLPPRSMTTHHTPSATPTTSPSSVTAPPSHHFHGHGKIDKKQ